MTFEAGDTVTIDPSPYLDALITRAVEAIERIAKAQEDIARTNRAINATLDRQRDAKASTHAQSDPEPPLPTEAYYFGRRITFEWRAGDTAELVTDVVKRVLAVMPGVEVKP